MIKEIIKELMQDIKKKESIDNDKAAFGKGYNTFSINQNNFEEIEISNETNIAFIDGGNGEILKSNNFSLQFIRICALGTKKLINEFYCLAYTIKKDNEIFYTSKIFQVKGEKLLEDNEISISSTDNSFKQGIFRANISIIGDIVRKVAERKIAMFVEEKNIVFDGTLETIHDKETSIVNSLNKNLYALAKTSTIFTENGNNLLAMLNNMKKGLWKYKIAESALTKHKANIFVVKLNTKSNYVFRFEARDSNTNVLDFLCRNSTDPVFLGYPYNLIKCDKFARVSNKEIEYMKTKIVSSLGQDFEVIDKYQNSVNAHSILDSI